VDTHQLQVERRTGKVRHPETDVLPTVPCHQLIYSVQHIISFTGKNLIKSTFVIKIRDSTVTRISYWYWLLSGGVLAWYLSGARCSLAYGPADATATHFLLLQ